MGKFLEREKLRQAAFKQSSSTFSEEARRDGIYRSVDHPYPFCVPREYAQENLIPEGRDSVRVYFRDADIKWHDGQGGNPSNHMCDSQVCCVNFLDPFAHHPTELATLLRPYYSDLQEMLPIEGDRYVAFEWIGAEDYLGEKVGHRNKIRSRGANATSADAAVRFKRTDGTIQVVLIEWKYTESYSPSSIQFAKSGRDRTTIYQALYSKDDCPIDKSRLSEFGYLFYEPFYQLMRQQLLAHEMEKVGELEAEVVSVLHIAPAANEDFRRITSDKLSHLGDTAIEVWKTLTNRSGRFQSVSTELLFGQLSVEQLPDMQTWRDYIYERYAWVTQPVP